MADPPMTSDPTRRFLDYRFPVFSYARLIFLLSSTAKYPMETLPCRQADEMVQNDFLRRFEDGLERA